MLLGASQARAGRFASIGQNVLEAMCPTKRMVQGMFFRALLLCEHEHHNARHPSNNDCCRSSARRLILSPALRHFKLRHSCCGIDLCQLDRVRSTDPTQVNPPWIKNYTDHDRRNEEHGDPELENVFGF